MFPVWLSEERFGNHSKLVWGGDNDLAHSQLRGMQSLPCGKELTKKW